MKTPTYQLKDLKRFIAVGKPIANRDMLEATIKALPSIQITGGLQYTNQLTEGILQTTPENQRENTVYAIMLQFSFEWERYPQSIKEELLNWAKNPSSPKDHTLNGLIPTLPASVAQTWFHNQPTRIEDHLSSIRKTQLGSIGYQPTVSKIIADTFHGTSDETISAHYAYYQQHFIKIITEVEKLIDKARGMYPHSGPYSEELGLQKTKQKLLDAAKKCAQAHIKHQATNSTTKWVA